MGRKREDDQKLVGQVGGTMNLSGEKWLRDRRAQAVFSLLETAGFQALAVGGCVRNALFNLPVQDVDISTDALPETVMKLAKKSGLKVVPTGIEHGTVTIVSGGVAFKSPPFAKIWKPTGGALW